MKKYVFQMLLRILTSPICGLTDDTKTGTGEKIVIFLGIMRGSTHRSGLSLWCLTPFRGMRHHLKEWNAAIAANILPQNSRELICVILK